jgi:hypothetical protein
MSTTIDPNMNSNIDQSTLDHLPAFITGPGETDILFNAVLVFLGISIVSIMILYFRLHALPEHLAHKGQKIQYEIVAVLALISLFTHNHLFWILGLLLAFISIPDFTTPLERMADSLARIAASKQPVTNIEPLPSPSRTLPYPQKAAGEAKDLSHV